MKGASVLALCAEQFKRARRRAGRLQYGDGQPVSIRVPCWPETVARELGSLRPASILGAALDGNQSMTIAGDWWVEHATEDTRASSPVGDAVSPLSLRTTSHYISYAVEYSRLGFEGLLADTPSQLAAVRSRASESPKHNGGVTDISLFCHRRALNNHVTRSTTMADRLRSGCLFGGATNNGLAN